MLEAVLMAEPNLAETRFAFLNADLDLANTFVKLAKTELAMSDRPAYERLLEKAQMALDTVRRLMNHPPEFHFHQREILTKRCQELESTIQSAIKR